MRTKKIVKVPSMKMLMAAINIRRACDRGKALLTDGGYKTVREAWEAYSADYITARNGAFCQITVTDRRDDLLWLLANYEIISGPCWRACCNPGGDKIVTGEITWKTIRTPLLNWCKKTIKKANEDKKRTR